jgi:ADP-ribosylglycohydrolase
MRAGHAGLAAAAGALMRTPFVDGAETDASSRGSLYDRIKGCIAGAYIGSSLGVPVEGWDRRKIAHRYGLLQDFQPFRTRRRGFGPGNTEDGMERQKYMYLAIIEKQDSITADDLVAVWLKIMSSDQLERMEQMVEPFDVELMKLALSGELPAARLGEHGYADLSAPIRCFHPIVIINACDEQGAIRDTHDVLRVYQPLDSNAYAWGAAYNAAAAHAMRADATVDSVIETALEYSDPEMKQEIQAGLDTAAKYDNPIEQRNDLYEDLGKIYNEQTCTGYYPMSRAHECATVALTMFKASRGNVKDAILLAVNFGRDTDCNAAASGGLAGAFSGTATIPPEWIQTVDAATKANQYTNSQLTIEETAKGMYVALESKVAKMQGYVERMNMQI